MMTPPAQTSPPLAQEWLDLQSAASVEVTSEDADFPIESALVRPKKGGWRAAAPGIQTIRLIFDEPQTLRRISLAFEESKTSRTQEFALRWPRSGKFISGNHAATVEFQLAGKSNEVTV